MTSALPACMQSYGYPTGSLSVSFLLHFNILILKHKDCCFPGQAGAIRLAISRALLNFEDSYLEPLQQGWVYIVMLFFNDNISFSCCDG